MLWTGDGKRLHLENLLHGASAFLVSNGPSVKAMPVAQLARPGVFTFGINNGPAFFRPNFWVMGDDTKSFVKSIWLDPKIIKCIPKGKEKQRIWDNEAWKEMDVRTCDCPSMIYFERNEHFQANTFLTEPSINWGNHSNRCICGFMRPDVDGKEKIRVCPHCGERRFGCRSIMFLAIRLAHILGVRTLYLLGADFKMTEDYTYSFDQARAPGSVDNNNKYYAEMIRRFDLLRPYFDKAGFRVFNCTPDSGLPSFPKMTFEDAISEATRDLPPAEIDQYGLWRIKERTEGLYDRKANEKKKPKKSAHRKIKTIEDLMAKRGITL